MGTGPYRGTVNLPQTKFNMRANSKQREPQLQKWWQQEQVYEGLSQNNTGPPFTLHDGPPYANGDLHCGHALNKARPLVVGGASAAGYCGTAGPAAWLGASDADLRWKADTADCQGPDWWPWSRQACLGK